MPRNDAPTRAKIAAALRGRPVPATTRQKLADAQRAYQQRVRHALAISTELDETKVLVRR